MSEQIECYNSGYQDGWADAKYASENLQVAIEDLAWWIKENLDGCPMIFRNDQLQAALYKQVEEYRDE